MDVGTNEILQAIRELSDNMDKKFEQVDKRFEQVDKRFEQVEYRLGKIEERLGTVEKNTSFLYTEVGRNALKIKQLTSNGHN